jgi:hypothetical protein
LPMQPFGNESLNNTPLMTTTNYQSYFLSSMRVTRST